MESQSELAKEVGTIESEKKTLEAKKVKIVKVDVIEVGANKNKKVTCAVEHPDADQQISISAVAYLKDKKVTNIGLWFSLDKEENIQKGSALAVFLNFVEAKNLQELEGKEVVTELDEKNFLCFRAY